MCHDHWKYRPYKVKSLVSNSIYAKKDRNDPPSANQVTSKDEPRCGHAVCTLWVHPKGAPNPTLSFFMMNISAMGPEEFNACYSIASLFRASLWRHLPRATRGMCLPTQRDPTARTQGRSVTSCIALVMERLVCCLLRHESPYPSPSAILLHLPSFPHFPNFFSPPSIRMSCVLLLVLEKTCSTAPESLERSSSRWAM